MKIFFKHLSIQLFILMGIGVGYAVWSDTVSTGDPVTATGWNEVITKIGEIDSNLGNLSFSGGNVGIGIANPTSPLHVNGYSRYEKQLLSFRENDTSTRQHMQFLRGGGGSVAYIQTTGDGSGNVTDMRFGINSLALMSILQNGNVGIGTTNPQGILHIEGSTSSSSGTTPLYITAPGNSEHMRLVPKSGISGATEGDIYANSNGILYYRSNSTWAAMNSAADYSELIVPLDFKKEVHDGTGYYTGEIGAAQIIVLNGEGYYERSSKPYDAKIAGIESGNRGLYDLREGSTDRREGQRQLGLIGHVKLQVTNENGLIKPGDFITTSSTPGAGMKATRPGRVVGIAKESAESHLDIIEVYLQPHTWLGENDYTELTPVLIEAIKELKQEKDTEIQTLKKRIQLLENK